MGEVKIFSKFQDYYDSAAAYGVDDHIHWIRNVSEIETKPNRYSPTFHVGDIVPLDPFYETDIYLHSPNSSGYHMPTIERSGTTSEVNSKVYFIGFCGKIYPMIRLTWKKTEYDIAFPNHVAYTYSLADVRDVFKRVDPKGKLLEKFDATPPRNKFKPWRYDQHSDYTATALTRYFDEFTASDKYMDLFVRHNTPIFVYCENNLWITPQLKEFGFQKMMDPFTAYQEIEMFLSGILGMNDPETVHIDDKHMAQQKGFDDWSFKKLPTKKK